MEAGRHEIDMEKFKRTWAFCKIKYPVDDFIRAYNNLENLYKADVVKAMDLPAITFMKDIFFFKGDTVDSCKNQFTDWLSKHKEFYNDNIHEIKRRMFMKREELNQIRANQALFAIEFINLFPEYGGKLQNAQSARQIDMLMYEAENYVLPWHNERIENALTARREAQRERRKRQKDE